MASIPEMKNTTLPGGAEEPRGDQEKGGLPAGRRDRPANRGDHHRHAEGHDQVRHVHGAVAGRISVWHPLRHDQAGHAVPGHGQ